MAKTQKTRGQRPAPHQASSPVAAASPVHHWEGTRPADPPRKRPWLLAASIILFFAWFMLLAYFALS